MARIIVIDDNDAVRSTMRRALEPTGHQVLEASDGEAGMKLLAETGADLVITDIFMPGQDGIVTLRRIRKEFPSVRVIAVSGGDATGPDRPAQRCRAPGSRADIEETVRAGGLEASGTRNPRPRFGTAALDRPARVIPGPPASFHQRWD